MSSQPFWLPITKDPEKHDNGGSEIQKVVNKNSDITLVGSPPDVVTSLAWSPNSHWISATSWATQLRVWEMKETHASIPRFSISFPNTPLLSTSWLTNEQVAFAMLDGTVASNHIEKCISSRLYTHDSGASCLATLPDSSLLISGSWDHTLKLYDVRSRTVAHTTLLADELFCMDAKQHLLLVGTADREVSTWDIRKLDRSMHGHTAKNSLQVRSIALMNDLSGYVHGSVNGRCHVVYYDDPEKTYGFRAHVTDSYGSGGEELHAVNTLQYHPIHTNLLTSGGSNGCITHWDTKLQRNVERLPYNVNMAITACRWAPNGASMVYAVGNDFSRATTNSFSKIYWHVPQGK